MLRCPGARESPRLNLLVGCSRRSGTGVATDQLVAAKWSQFSNPEVILDQPDLMFGADDRKAEFGFAVPGYIFDPNPGSDARTPTLPTDARMAADHRRLVYVDNGDIWRAEWDWKNGALVNKKQVTTSGVFGGKSILVWYGNTILMRTEFNKARPILKLDLVTGQTEEMGTYGAIDYGMMVNRGRLSPFSGGHRYAVHLRPSQR